MFKVKVWMANFLKAPQWGRLVAWIYNNRIPFYKSQILTDSHLIHDRIKAALYFKLYESSEVRFIYEYLRRDLPVVELGSSIGVVASQIAMVNKRPLICVEANPQYKQIIEKNLRHNKKANFKVINAAIGNQDESLWFEPGVVNTGGRLTTKPSEKTLQVQVLSLSQLLSEQNIKEFTLVCDIEGSELDILSKDAVSLDHCKQMIIELHHVKRHQVEYPVQQLDKMIKELGFMQIASHGSIRVYEK